MLWALQTLCIIKILLALPYSAEVKQTRTGKFVLWFSPAVQRGLVGAVLKAPFLAQVHLWKGLGHCKELWCKCRGWHMSSAAVSVAGEPVWGLILWKAGLMVIRPLSTQPALFGSMSAGVTPVVTAPLLKGKNFVACWKRAIAFEMYHWARLSCKQRTLCGVCSWLAALEELMVTCSRRGRRKVYLGGVELLCCCWSLILLREEQMQKGVRTRAERGCWVLLWMGSATFVCGPFAAVLGPLGLPLLYLCSWNISAVTYLAFLAKVF